MRTAMILVLAFVALLSAGCGAENLLKKSDTPPKLSLYDRLGGKPAVMQVVDDFVGYAAVDPKVNFTRKGVPGAEWEASTDNVVHLKMALIDYITMATGGPNTYKGKNMRDAHKNMQITSDQFDAAAADLKQALDKNRVPTELQKELLDIVETTKKDIVTKK